LARCGKCNRGLKDPTSVLRGYGPICWGKVQADRAREEAGQDQLLPGFDGDVVCRRVGGRIETNIPRVITRHSPDGFEWGYGGSGPADFALNIMAAFIGADRAQRSSLYQEFKWDFIATMPWEGGVIRKADILAWLDRHGVKVA
jgi:hypothetical protein